MPKLKLDIQGIKSTLTSRYEILGLVVAGCLVLVCLLWGLSNLLGASSPENDIMKDVQRIQGLRRAAEGPAADTKKKVDPKKEAQALFAWAPMPLVDPKLNLYPYYEKAMAGSNLRS